MRLPPVLRAFLATSALCTVLCLGTEWVCRFLLHWGSPYDYPGVHTYLRFVDFHAFFDKFRFFHSRAFYTQPGVLPYPAPAIAAYKFFLVPQPSPHHGTAAIARYEGSMLASLLVMVVLFARSLVRRGLQPMAAMLFTLGAIACSFAFWFEFFQGNIEWVVWVFVTLAIYSFWRGWFPLAAACIGIAGSMKLYPIILVGLFLPKKQIREILLTAAAAVVSTLVSLWLVCPDIAYSWTRTLAGLGAFEQTYMVKVRPVEVGFDHSLFALVKLVLNIFAGPANLQARIGVYLATVALGGCLLFVLRIRKLPFTNQVLCLTVAAITLPPLSYDYTLIHLYPALALLTLVALQGAKAEASQTSAQNKGLLTALLLLAFVLSPQSEFIAAGIRFSGQLKCLALLALGYVGLRYPFPLAGLAFDRPRVSATVNRPLVPASALRHG